MFAASPNRDTRPDRTQQYNQDFYVDEREQPPGSSLDDPVMDPQQAPSLMSPSRNSDDLSPREDGYNQNPLSGDYYAQSYDPGAYGDGGQTPPVEFGRNVPYDGAPGGGGSKGPPAEESRGSHRFNPISVPAPPRPKSGPGVGKTLEAGGRGSVMMNASDVNVDDYYDYDDDDEYGGGGCSCGHHGI